MSSRQDQNERFDHFGLDLIDIRAYPPDAMGVGA
jgi:hypothetical protein